MVGWLVAAARGSGSGRTPAHSCARERRNQSLPAQSHAHPPTVTHSHSQSLTHSRSLTVTHSQSTPTNAHSLTVTHSHSQSLTERCDSTDNLKPYTVRRYAPWWVTYPQSGLPTFTNVVTAAILCNVSSGYIMHHAAVSCE